MVFGATFVSIVDILRTIGDSAATLGKCSRVANQTVGEAGLCIDRPEERITLHPYPMS